MKLLAAVVVMCSLAIAGCAGPSGTGPYQPQTEAGRDPAGAQRLTLEAADLIHKDPVQAERLLRDALTRDLYHGPAHNDLGVVYLSQGKTYEAASEFEFARKLMPGHPDPRVNLAIALERAGRIDEALSTFRAALEVYPGYVAAMEGIVRLQLRSGKADDGTGRALSEIAMRGESEPWRAWARLQLSKQRLPGSGGRAE